MKSKKNIFMSILVVLLISIVVFTVTYAYIVFITNEENIDTGSGMLGINYGIPNDLVGSLAPAIDRDGGIMSTATASLKNSSEKALFNLYILPTSLTNLNVAAFKWEAEGFYDDNLDGVYSEGETLICSDTGNFSDSIVGERMPVLQNCELSTDTATFNIYVWIDVKEITTSLAGASFSGKITADSVDITGGF